MTIEAVFRGSGDKDLLGGLAVPSGSGRHPTVLIVHEWWGLNDDINAIAERFAAEGFVALAVDLYKGRTTTSAAEAVKLANELKIADALPIVEAGRALAAAHPRSNGRVGILGFCLGGGVAFAAACQNPALEAAVPFYGTPPDEFLTFERARCPILAHFGQKDQIIPPKRVEAVKARAAKAGASLTVHFYDAGHAFMRKHDASFYEPASATLAWERTLAFLRGALGRATG
ncbi:MAG: dienelactone hydrolase family protein [Polyangiaceae bacterium]